MQTPSIAEIALLRSRWADVFNRVIHHFGGYVRRNRKTDYLTIFCVDDEFVTASVTML